MGNKIQLITEKTSILTFSKESLTTKIHGLNTHPWCITFMWHKLVAAGRLNQSVCEACETRIEANIYEYVSE